MNIKSLLLGSAALLAASYTAQAADAIVAAEPEPMEYVRVCDAFGTGYFYIPGTETCLRVGGYVRFQVGVNRDEVARGLNINLNPQTGVQFASPRTFDFGAGTQENSDWDAWSRARIEIEAKTDTELGTLTSYIALEATTDDSGNGGGAAIDEAYIQLGGFKAGYFLSWWDKGLNGETDSLSLNAAFNSIAYTYDGGAFQVGVSIDELENLDWGQTAADRATNGLGVTGIVTAALGGVAFDLLGSYDSEADEGAIRALLSAELGLGTLQVAGVYATDPNSYWAVSEWSVAASYQFKATDKLTITPAAQYWGDYMFFNDADMWRVGVTAGYQITDGLAALATVDYNDIDLGANGSGDFTRGFFRLQRSF